MGVQTANICDGGVADGTQAVGLSDVERARYREKILPLHSVWLDLLILRMQGGCEDENAKPVWFVLDELASLNKLPQLHSAVTENRKYGNPVVLGFQGRSQLEKRYGQDAEAMVWGFPDECCSPNRSHACKRSDNVVRLIGIHVQS